jgi:hypothetical protein
MTFRKLDSASVSRQKRGGVGKRTESLSLGPLVELASDLDS